MWYAQETELPNIIGQDETKFQDHKCSTALSPKHPLKSNNIGPSVAQTVAVIIISPLTLAINRRKLGEEGVQKIREKIVKRVRINWALFRVSLPRTTHSRKSSSPLQINCKPKCSKAQQSYSWFLQLILAILFYKIIFCPL